MVTKTNLLLQISYRILILPIRKGVWCKMGDQYKTCELHGKPFPNNMVDTRKTEVVRMYIEKPQEIEGKFVKLNLIVGEKNENEGIDVCAQCLQEKVLTLLAGNGETPLWKQVVWAEQTFEKKDGSGTYKKNIKSLYTVPEIAERIKAEKKNAPAQTAK